MTHAHVLTQRYKLDEHLYGQSIRKPLERGTFEVSPYCPQREMYIYSLH